MNQYEYLKINCLIGNEFISCLMDTQNIFTNFWIVMKLLELTQMFMFQYPWICDI